MKPCWCWCWGIATIIYPPIKIKKYSLIKFTVVLFQCHILFLGCWYPALFSIWWCKAVALVQIICYWSCLHQTVVYGDHDNGRTADKSTIQQTRWDHEESSFCGMPFDFLEILAVLSVNLCTANLLKFWYWRGRDWNIRFLCSISNLEMVCLLVIQVSAHH